MLIMDDWLARRLAILTNWVRSQPAGNVITSFNSLINELESQRDAQIMNEQKSPKFDDVCGCTLPFVICTCILYDRIHSLM